MECTTIRKDVNGLEFEKPKAKFDTLEKAITHCQKENVREERTEKVAPYKCKTCCKYHVGRNGSLITEKEKEKLKKLLEPKFTVVGKIDLDSIWKPKPKFK